MRQSKLPPGSKVFILARHSPGKNQSIEIQLKLLFEHCERNGLIISDGGVFIDAGKSGKDPDRKGFNDLIKLIEASPTKLVDGILFYERSRLARNFTQSQYAKWLLAYRGYHVECLIGEQLEGVAGVIVDDTKDWYNAEALEENRQRIRDYLKQTVLLKDENGEYLRVWPARVPWGFRTIAKELPIFITLKNKRRVKQCLAPDYDKWPLGRELFELKAARFSYRQIENRTGFMASRGVKFEDTDIISTAYRYFFRNKIYMGTFEYSDIAIPEFIEPMVPPELWEEANATAWDDQRQVWRGGKHPKSGQANPIFILAGLCECEYHNSPFYTRSLPSRPGWARYYFCKSYRRMKEACPSGYIRAAEFEQAVLDDVEAHYLSGEFVLMVTEQINSLLSNRGDYEREIERAKAELERVKKELTNLAQFIREIGVTDELRQEFETLKGQKELAKNKLDQLSAARLPEKINVSPKRVGQALEQFRERLTDETRAVLQQIVRSININSKEATIHYRLPVTIGDTSLQSLVGNVSGGYVIELPKSRKKDTNELILV